MLVDNSKFLCSISVDRKILLFVIGCSILVRGNGYACFARCFYSYKIEL